MAIWLLVSATYPIFFFATIYKALRHWRRLRARAAQADAIGIRRESAQPEDWVAAR